MLLDLLPLEQAKPPVFDSSPGFAAAIWWQWWEWWQRHLVQQARITQDDENLILLLASL